MKDLPSGPIHPRRILVVDDESMPRMTIARALNLMGYRAEEAVNGSEALAKLSARFFDLMLLDLRMPGMDGLEVMRQANELCPNTLVIVLTAYGNLQSAIAALRLGAADYLLKPYSLRSTEAAIARALERRHSDGSYAAAPDQAARFLQYGPVILDLEKRLATVASPDDPFSRQAELTRNEAALLAHLMQSPDAVFSCRDLARSPLGYDVSEREAEDIVRPHISRLRKKVEVDPAHPTLIRTIPGKGYFFSA